MTKITKIIYSSICGILLFLALLFIIIGVFQKKNIIAFYNIDLKTKTSIQDTLLSTPNIKQKKYTFIDLDSEIPLSQQQELLKKVSIVFAAKDFDVMDYVKTTKKVKPLSAEYMDGFPVSIINTIPTDKDSVKYLPVLYDFYQFDVNYPIFQKTGSQTINVWNDILKTANNSQKLTPVPVNGSFGNTETFLNFAGILAEALSTPQEYENMIKNIYDGYKGGTKELEEALETEMQADKPLAKALNEISRLKYEKLITREAADFSKTDASFFADNELCLFYFDTLSEHRKIQQKIINNYKTIYCPAKEMTVNRKFCAPEIDLFCLKNKKEFSLIITNLVRTNQTKLCTESGLCPVQKNCVVPDHQADDVRYWLAASSGPVMPLTAALPSKEAREKAVEYLKK